MHPDTLALMIPIAVVGLVMGLAAFKAWIDHREKMDHLRMEQQERAAERDAALFGSSAVNLPAHLDAVLVRLGEIEQRLDRLEGRPTAPTPEVLTRRRAEREETERA